MFLEYSSNYLPCNIKHNNVILNNKIIIIVGQSVPTRGNCFMFKHLNAFPELRVKYCKKQIEKYDIFLIIS